MLRPAPKVYREKPAPKRIAKVSKRHDPTWWPAQAAKVIELQRGLCAACLKGGSLDACHIIALERTGGTRHDADNPLNAIENLLGMHRYPCHQEFDRQSKAWRITKGAELKARFDVLDGHGVRRTGGR